MDMIWSLFVMPLTTLRKSWLHLNLFLHSLRHSRSTLPVEPEYLQSSSFNLVNPRHHIVATDDVTQQFSSTTSASLDVLSDEQVLALFTHGFFAGPVFGPERLILSSLDRLNIPLLPTKYTGPSVRSSAFSPLPFSSPHFPPFQIQRPRCSPRANSTTQSNHQASTMPPTPPP